MFIALFFIVLSVWCAEREFDVPYQWFRPAHFARERFVELSSPLEGLGNAIIVSEEKEEIVCFYNDPYHLWLHVYCGQEAFLDGKTLQVAKEPVLSIQKACKCNNLCGRGAVFLRQDADERGCLIINTPQDKKLAPFVFSTNGRAPGVRCSGRVDKNGFSGAAFLHQYDDAVRLFVRVKFSYDHMKKIPVIWGEINSSGVAEEKGSCTFIFNECTRCDGDVGTFV